MTACPRFPPEISDYIVDIVHSGGQAETLKRCCLVSKSWVPRTRKHLFATVEIWGVRDVRAWKTVFPNPSNSPAHYARSLFFNSMEPINDVVAEEDGWIRAFQNVVRLELQNGARHLYFRSLRSFLLGIASLYAVLMIYPSQQLQVLSLICSLPLLEDLVIRFSGALGWEGGNETVLHPLTPPPLTGTLETYRFQGVEHFIPRLLDQLKGVHFRKLECWWDSEEDIQRAVTCVDACSNTLEYVDVCSLVHGTFTSAFVVCLAHNSDLRLNQGARLRLLSTSRKRRNSKK